MVDDIDTELHQAAEYVEQFTEEFLTEFPDVVYRWEWFGDNSWLNTHANSKFFDTLTIVRDLLLLQFTHNI